MLRLTGSRKKIYFDGFLPKNKYKTRRARLQSYTKQLSNYYEAWPQVIPSTPRSQTSGLLQHNLFPSEPVSSRLTQIPAAPFLVPAVIEALCKSLSYQDMVEVVPGEADLYCAGYLNEHGGIVLTSDSDLLVHDLGISGGVTFFRDVQLIWTLGEPSIRGVQYRISAIIERLGLPVGHGLSSLAFEISMDVHASLPQLLRRATKLTAIRENGIEYEKFLTQYARLPSEVESSIHTDGGEQMRCITSKSLLRRLDPRVSEFVLQIPVFADIAGLKAESDKTSRGGPLNVFLPFIIDCPVKTSAWEISISIRLIAYGALNLGVLENEKFRTVTEYGRQQSEGQGRTWHVPSTLQMQEACASLNETIAQIRNIEVSLSDSEIWTVLAMHQNIIWASESNKESLCFKLIRVPAENAALKERLDWDTIHFLAQLSSSIYSFRMLKQSLAASIPCGGSDVSFPALTAIYHELRMLPPLSELWRIDGASDWLRSAEAERALTIACKILDIEDVTRAGPKTPARKDKKKRKRDRSEQVDDTPQVPPANIFELLSSE
ncbi:MAG: hypothetical protein M1818_001635 [Claussenomyces sp. TS43310]|nr:MAG: hypothetical protein M1818_001635 [Claussenomyces sp. TS43310]